MSEPNAEQHIDQIILDEREKWRRINDPTRKERWADFWWAVGDESKLLAKALWHDLIVPGVVILLESVVAVAFIITIGYLLAQGFHLAGF